MPAASKGPWEYYVRKVNVCEPHKCWNWLGSVGGPGYGTWLHARRGEKPRGAHRATYELFFGIPEGLQINHKCGNKRCCNPDHLYAGTQAENFLDTVKHGTYSPPPTLYGQDNASSILTPEIVREIRKRCGNGEKQVILAKEFKVSPDAIRAVYKRKNWAWVED